MNWFELNLTIFGGSLIAGLIGSLTGLGGGVIIIPMLALALGIDIRYAIGASLVSVIATSSGAAAAYVKEGFTNIRIGMFLEMATTVGAVLGAGLAGLLPTDAIAVIFGCVLVYSTWLTVRPAAEIPLSDEPDRLATRLHMNGSYPDGAVEQPYHVQHVPQGFAVMSVAGALSGLLGIGSGAVKVLAMDTVMRIPFKVSTTTSNFMIGVTAAASAGIYLNRGYIDPGLTFPVMLGVLSGAWLGTKVLVRARTKALRVLFALVILILGLEMIYKGLTGGM
jgi:uncharacterized membrane protein YfcA